MFVDLMAYACCLFSNKNFIILIVNLFEENWERNLIIFFLVSTKPNQTKP